MRVWLLTVGEPLPTDGRGDRLWRTALLARALVERGHEVIWWSSAFDHFRHATRTPVDVPVLASPGLSVCHLSGRAYQRNVSLARLLNHRQVASSFTRLAETQPRPDVVLSSLPIIELCVASVAYGITRRVPVALDIRDLWPDVLADLVPSPLRPAARLGLRWMTAQLKQAATGATAVLGVTDEFVSWALDAAGRARRAEDRAFPMAYARTTPGEGELAEARKFWRAHGITGHRPVVCFFGTLGWMFDFDTVLRAARRLHESSSNVVFVLCGGNNVDDLRRRAKGLPNVVLPGHVGAAAIHELMRESIAGLAPYRPFRNFQDNLPNKPIEYFSAGLPVITSEIAVLAALVRDQGCGIVYPHGDDAALAGAVADLTANPARRAQLSARASTVFEERFVAERVYADMAAHLERLAHV